MKKPTFFSSEKHFNSKWGSGTKRFILLKVIYIDTNQFFLFNLEATVLKTCRKFWFCLFCSLVTWQWTGHIVLCAHKGGYLPHGLLQVLGSFEKRVQVVPASALVYLRPWSGALASIWKVAGCEYCVAHLTFSLWVLQSSLPVPTCWSWPAPNRGHLPLKSTPSLKTDGPSMTSHRPFSTAHPFCRKSRHLKNQNLRTPVTRF